MPSPQNLKTGFDTGFKLSPRFSATQSSALKPPRRTYIFRTTDLYNLLVAVVFVFLFSLNGAAQNFWLDQTPLPNWNERSRAIPQGKKISADELKRCSVTVRPATLTVDRLVTRAGWTLVGEAQIFGRTTVLTVTESFDGMCRPLGFQTLVFVGSRLAGTLSPAPMDSRTDGSISNVRLTTETSVTAEYVRYRDSDALCCPYKTEAVFFEIKPAPGANFLLVPDSKAQIGINTDNQPSGAAGELKNTTWRWEGTQTPVENVAVSNPENYTLEFTADDKVNVQADCNRGRGVYQSDGKSLTFSGIALTRRACLKGSLDSRFLRGLQAARIYRIEGDKMLIDLFADGGTMRFARVPR